MKCQNRITRSRTYCKKLSFLFCNIISFFFLYNEKLIFQNSFVYEDQIGEIIGPTMINFEVKDKIKIPTREIIYLLGALRVLAEQRF